MTPILEAHDALHRNRTLWLCTLLHAFTHVYQVALLPLYLLVRRDFGLANDGKATLLVTVMGIAYFLPSYGMGILADKVSRKRLLGIGLVINALGFIGLSQATQYGSALAWMAISGLGGSFYHPAATALVARLFPEGRGRALGKVGIGAGVGFFIGPIYAGWRATSAGWRAPVLELGLLGLGGALLFFWLAKDHPVRRREPHDRLPAESLFPDGAAWACFLGAAFFFAMRDFAGSGMASLGSLFLQRAHDYTPAQTGLALCVIYLASVVSNPLFGGLSDRARLRWTGLVLFLSAGTILLFPRLSGPASIADLALFGFFFMASYPMVEAALMDSVPDAVRGRVFGLFITVGGLLGNISHWMVGDWVNWLGRHAHEPARYIPFYRILALLVLVSLAGLKFLHLLRRRENPALPRESPQ